MVEYMHDIMDRVTNISWRTTSGAAIGGFQYEYDAAGRIVSRFHPIGVGDRLASYGRARSPSAPQSVVGEYTYDAAGLVLFARPIMAPRFLLENSPKPMLPKPQSLTRTSPLLKDWGPGKPIPKGFRPPPKPGGNWHKPFTKESLHNDMNHPKPFEPHWDYIDTEGNHYRWFPDGRIIQKPLRSFQLPQPNDDEREGVGSAEEKSVRFA